MLQGQISRQFPSLQHLQRAWMQFRSRFAVALLLEQSHLGAGRLAVCRFITAGVFLLRAEGCSTRHVRCCVSRLCRPSALVTLVHQLSQRGRCVVARGRLPQERRAGCCTRTLFPRRADGAGTSAVGQRRRGGRSAAHPFHLQFSADAGFARQTQGRAEADTAAGGVSRQLASASALALRPSRLSLSLPPSSLSRFLLVPNFG